MIDVKAIAIDTRIAHWASSPDGASTNTACPSEDLVRAGALAALRWIYMAEPPIRKDHRLRIAEEIRALEEREGDRV